MVDQDLIELAFRARVVALVVATTGSTTLSATATGYARSAGSFITDGFRVGHEVIPSGFPQTDYGIVVAVSALTMTIQGGRTVATAASGRALAVGLPATRKLDDNLDFTPVAGRPYVECEFVPAPVRLRTGPAQGGTNELEGLYKVRWYGLANTGAQSIRNAVKALEALFTPGTAFTAGADAVRVRGDVGPFATPITQRAGGWALCVLTIPWRVYSANVVVP